MFVQPLSALSCGGRRITNFRSFSYYLCGVSGQPRDTMVSRCGVVSLVSPEILWSASKVHPDVSGHLGDTIPIKCGGYVSQVISDILWSDGVVSPGQPRDTVASKCSAMSPVSPEILWPASVACVCVSGQPRYTMANKCSMVSPVSPEILWSAETMWLSLVSPEIL